MKKYFLFIILLGAIISCTVDPDIPGKNQPTLDFTTPVSNITSISARSGGLISSNGGHVIIERGICWSTNTSPTISNSKVISNGGVGNFSCDINGLITGTNYYVRAFVTTTTGTVYANQLSFTTLSTPTMTTSGISSITNSSATSGGNITNSGGSNITARGVCWSTTPGPTISLSTKTVNGTGNGSYTSLLSGLAPGTMYFVRAYATNIVGTSYGGELSFTTQNIPSVTTNSVTSITSSSAICGGNVVSNGGATVTARGICWSTTVNPTIANSRTINGSGSGPFSSAMTGLLSGRTYYVRAYATNSWGTAYGSNIAFTTN
ncbi:MAG TPA: hypothetical protein PLG08_10270 [Chitinophagaceae bacterium]|nr:hypothetical protein [Bacteroidota bacterium]HQV61152.1 hypothetical protein [Chitinophagaceae bacterium]HQV85238.1 hypothetical protein [Chitinophagaceae bacterium]